VLPDPAKHAPGGVEAQHVRLETTYYDTAARDLLRHRLTLRRRAGEIDTGWQLKVPERDGARTEIRLPGNGNGRTVPTELREATLGVRGGAALRPVARLVTERDIHRLLETDGGVLAEIVVDVVSAAQLGETAQITRWREVEVELVKGDEELLQELARWLRKRGAVPAAAASKLARALDTEPAARRDLGTLAGLAGTYLDAQAAELVCTDIALRRRQNEIHDARVATRRYRSVVRELSVLFEPARAAALDAELKHLADALGEVRDRHVLRAHLDKELAELPPGLVLGPVADRIHQLLAAEEADAAERLAAQLRTKRHYALLAEVRAWREQLPVEDDRPAGDVARILRKAERKVTRRIAGAPKGEGRDEGLHRARKAAKRARYVAELARPELGKQAKAARRRMKKTQDRLGRRQDRVVAAEFLRRAGVAADAARHNGFTFGLLYAREQARTAELD
jgi:CHAD domain-containing protein